MSGLLCDVNQRRLPGARDAYCLRGNSLQAQSLKTNSTRAADRFGESESSDKSEHSKFREHFSILECGDLAPLSIHQKPRHKRKVVGLLCDVNQRQGSLVRSMHTVTAETCFKPNRSKRIQLAPQTVLEKRKLRQVGALQISGPLVFWSAVTWHRFPFTRNRD